MLSAFLFSTFPLMVPYLMPDPTTYKQHTNPLPVLSADRSQSLYVTPILSRCLLSYFTLAVTCTPVVYCPNSLWMSPAIFV